MNQVAPSSTGAFSAPTARYRLSYQAIQAIAAAVDATAFILAGVCGFVAYRHHLTGEFVVGDDGLGVGFVAGVFFLALAQARGLYRTQTLLFPARRLRHLALIVSLALFALISCMFLLKVGAQYSRGSVIAFGVLAFLFVIAERIALARFMAAGVRLGAIAGRRVVVIGEISELDRLAPSDFGDFGLAEIARIGVAGDDDGGLGERGRMQVAAAIALAREFQASAFVLTLRWSSERLLAEIDAALRASPLTVTLLPDFAIRGVVGNRRKGGLDAALAVDIQRQPLSRLDRLCKRAIDLALSLAAIALLAPLLMLTALAIRLDSPGPALFRQRRVGFDNREFVIFKFRTMTARDDGPNVPQARRDDARVTRIGRLLRRSSLDELPQLLNVIRGEMSLVGPRPHAVAHHDQYAALIGSYAFRHHVKPGLTGMAQVRGLRGETSELAAMENRVEQDLWYIDNWSLALDFAIMGRTCLVLLRQDAY